MLSTAKLQEQAPKCWQGCDSQRYVSKRLIHTSTQLMVWCILEQPPLPKSNIPFVPLPTQAKEASERGRKNTNIFKS